MLTSKFDQWGFLPTTGISRMKEISIKYLNK